MPMGQLLLFTCLPDPASSTPSPYGPFYKVQSLFQLSGRSVNGRPAESELNLHRYQFDTSMLIWVLVRVWWMPTGYRQQIYAGLWESVQQNDSRCLFASGNLFVCHFCRIMMHFFPYLEVGSYKETPLLQPAPIELSGHSAWVHQ